MLFLVFADRFAVNTVQKRNKVSYTLSTLKSLTNHKIFPRLKMEKYFSFSRTLPENLEIHGLFTDFNGPLLKFTDFTDLYEP